MDVSQNGLDSKLASDSVTTHPLDLLETNLRTSLLDCSLVCEARLSVEVINSADSAFRQIWKRELPLRRFPAITVVFLANAAREQYHAGSLWPELPLIPSPGNDQRLQKRLGNAFVRAIKRLALAPLDGLRREGASRYVSLIVGHSGIPNYCVPDFLSLVTNELEHGSGIASAMIAGWRQAPTTKFKTTDRPVQRFLLHGGEVAEDFLDRCVDLICANAEEKILPDPDSAGLPGQLLEAIRDGAAPLRKGVAERERIPVPSVRMMEWDRLGPRMVLPEASGAAARGGKWEVESDAGLTHVSAIRLLEVPLSPSVSWTVRLCASDGKPLREWVFPGPSHGFLLFDTMSGKLLPTTANDLTLRVPHERITVAYLDGSFNFESLTGTRLAEDLGALDGEWQAFHASILQMDHDRVSLTISESVVRLTHRARVLHLEGIPIAHVTSVTGHQVYSSLPQARVHLENVTSRTRVEVRVDGGPALTLTADDLATHTENLFSHPGFDWVQDYSEPFQVRLIHRASLGSDQRETFVVVPGLNIERPRRSPIGSEKGKLSISTATMPLQVVHYAADVETVSFEVLRTAQSGIALSIAVPATVWRVTGGAEERKAGREVVILHEEDLKAERPLRLWLRTGAQGQSVSVRIRDGDRIGPTQAGVTCGPEGEWTVNLKQWTDEVLRATTESVTVEYISGFEQVEILKINTDLGLQLHGIEAGGDRGFVTVQITGEEHRRARGRLVRLWRASQPWLDPLDHQVPDDASIQGYQFALPEDSVPPGRYLVTLLIDDGWNPLPRHPQKHRSCSFWIGDPHTAREWIDEHRQGSTTMALERAWRFGELTPARDAPSMWLAEAMATLAAQAYLPPLEHNPDAVGRLVGLHHSEFASIAVDPLQSMELPERLAVCLPLIGPLADGLYERPPPEVAERLWNTAAPWALACALGANEDLQEWRELLGGVWKDGCLLGGVQSNPAETIVRFWGQPVPMLKLAITNACPRPTRVCDADAVLRACFDWLVAESGGWFSCADWVRIHANLFDDPESRTLCNQHWGIAALLRGVPEHSRAAARFPRMVTAAAWHATGCGYRHDEAVFSLLEICADVPALVNWALVAALIGRHQSGSGDLR